MNTIIGTLSNSMAMTVVLACLSLVGCRERQREPVRSEPEKAVETPVVLEDQSAKHEEMLKAHAKARPFVIGGCRESCRTHKEAFQNYVEALRKRDGGLSSIAYLETSEMVYNGIRKGDTWVEMWRSGAREERLAAIELFASEVGAWINGVDDADVERALATSVHFEEDDDPGFLVHFRPPGDQATNEWRFRIQERGWEWLISAIDTR